MSPSLSYVTGSREGEDEGRTGHWGIQGRFGLSPYVLPLGNLSFPLVTPPAVQSTSVFIMGDQATRCSVTSRRKYPEYDYRMYSELPGLWATSIVRNSTRKHNVSETGSVSVFG
jgi:hypothetical protein